MNYPVIGKWLFPSSCALCGKLLFTKGESRYGLCAPCRESLCRDGNPRCISCGRPLISEFISCMVCRAEEKQDLDRVYALFPYSGKYREILRAYKFGKNRHLAYFLARELFCFLGSRAKEDAIPDVWVPVPPRPGKIKNTGWDQLDYFSRRLTAYTKLLKKESPNILVPPFRIYPCLKRFHSQSQKTLGLEERKRNLKGRIIASKRVPERVLLLDDIITTGSTLNASAAALKANGAHEVYAVAFFYD